MPFDARLVSGIGVLAAVVETGGFAKAAQALGLTQPAVSRAIARLEARIGVRLLDRTTRSVTLTDEGRRFYEHVGPLLGGIEEAAALAAGSAAAVRGRLRVNLEPYFSRLVLAPRLSRFLDRYPEISLDFVTTGHVGDLVAGGFDLAIRFGTPTSTSIVARKLIDTRIVTVAAPAYLERHGRPASLADLAAHDCIQYRNPQTGLPFQWQFHRAGEIVPVATTGRLLLTDVGTMLSACLAGAGIAKVMALGVGDLIEQGQLVELFADWPDETFPLYALHPSRHLPAAKVRAFMDFILEAVA
jgi:DNA-binding transcriptional LysR family regulator